MRRILGVSVIGLLVLGCTSERINPGMSVAATGGFGGAGGVGGEDEGFGGFGYGGLGGGVTCTFKCSLDSKTVLDCDGNVVASCESGKACDVTTGSCLDACEAVANNKQAVGCDYVAAPTDVLESTLGDYERCFAAFVANTWDTPAHITVTFDGQTLDPSTFGRIPTGPGPYPALLPYDNAEGLQPGEVVALFLAGTLADGDSPCPLLPAVTSGVAMYDQTGIGKGFRIQTDVPVVAYQMSPYDGIDARTAAVSLLLPTSAWDRRYLAVMAGPWDELSPSMNILAAEDDTTITLTPTNAVDGGGGVPAGVPNQPMTFTLQAGEQAQLTQDLDLTGSLLEADKPIGLIAAHQCMRAPLGGVSEGNFNCDHAAQMVPPLSALGSEFVGVMHRQRIAEPAIWKLVGAVDGTVLTWSGVSGPAVINRGETALVLTADPFVVKSQDEDHPFMVFAEMVGAYNVSVTPPDGFGDTDFVYVPPVDQYLGAYTFYALPQFPEANLVVVRTRREDDTFAPVYLDCLGELEGWTPIGDYEWTRVDLTTDNFQDVGPCSAARRTIESEAPFGLWVWGWGSPLTFPNTRSVSYGFPAGMSLRPINDVQVIPR